MPFGTVVRIFESCHLGLELEDIPQRRPHIKLILQTSEKLGERQQSLVGHIIHEGLDRYPIRHLKQEAGVAVVHKHGSFEVSVEHPQILHQTIEGTMLSEQTMAEDGMVRIQSIEYLRSIFFLSCGESNNLALLAKFPKELLQMRSFPNDDNAAIILEAEHLRPIPLVEHLHHLLGHLDLGGEEFRMNQCLIHVEDYGQFAFILQVLSW